MRKYFVHEDVVEACRQWASLYEERQSTVLSRSASAAPVASHAEPPGTHWVEAAAPAAAFEILCSASRTLESLSAAADGPAAAASHALPAAAYWENKRTDPRG